MHLRERLRAALVAIKCRNVWRLFLRVSFAFLKSLLSTRPVSSETGMIVYANCPPFGGEPFHSYLRGLGQMAKGECIPLVVHVSVTDLCDHHCARCSNIPSSKCDPTLGELTRLLQEFKGAGTASAAFTGGEPTLRSDLTRIIETSGKELSPILFTSGQRLDWRCHTLSLVEFMEPGVAPVQWEHTRIAMEKYSPGKPPDLMKWIMRKGISE